MRCNDWVSITAKAIFAIAMLVYAHKPNYSLPQVQELLMNYCATYPPSIDNMVPVTKLASSLIR
jgi:hypothetical protein